MYDNIVVSVPTGLPYILDILFVWPFLVNSFETAFLEVLYSRANFLSDIWTLSLVLLTNLSALYCQNKDKLLKNFRFQSQLDLVRKLLRQVLFNMTSFANHSNRYFIHLVFHNNSFCFYLKKNAVYCFFFASVVQNVSDTSITLIIPI